MEGKIYLIENQDDEMLGLFVCFLNKLCSKMMISLRLELQNLSMRTLRNVLGCTQGLHGMGLIVATIQQVLFWLQQEWD